VALSARLRAGVTGRRQSREQKRENNRYHNISL
jgi:hypothetical protein